MEKPPEQSLAVGGGGTGDFLLYTSFSKFPSVNMHCLYKAMLFALLRVTLGALHKLDKVLYHWATPPAVCLPDDFDD